MQSTKGRILCTEDDVDTRELIDFVLTQYGYEVVCPASNVQAIDLAQTQNFDLYLVDNWMPGLSGTELTEKVTPVRSKDTRSLLLRSGVRD